MCGLFHFESILSFSRDGFISGSRKSFTIRTPDKREYLVIIRDNYC